VQNYQLKATVQVKKAVVKPFYTSLGAAFEQNKLAYSRRNQKIWQQEKYA
jgi:hypothetical protein